MALIFVTNFIGISIGAGAAGTLIGGYASDRLVSKLGISARALVLAISQVLNNPKLSLINCKLICLTDILNYSQLIASPFAFALFFLEPPLALFSLLAAYIAGKYIFGMIFTLSKSRPNWISNFSRNVVWRHVCNSGGTRPYRHSFQGCVNCTFLH